MQAYIGKITPMSTGWQKDLCIAVYFAGCDFGCPYCNTADVIDFKQDFLKDLRDVKKEIEEHQGFHKSILFTGGEPCLQRQALLNLARYFKEKGFKIGIETNGSKPETILSLIKENLVDFISIDLKSAFRTELFEKVTKSRTFFRTTNEIIEDLRRTINLLKKYEDNVTIEVKTTIVPGLMFRKEDLEEIAKEIKGLNCVWVLQSFKKSETVLDKTYRDIGSPSQDFIENLRTNILKQYPNIRIEVRSEED